MLSTASYTRDAMVSGIEAVVVSSPDDLCLHRAFASALLLSPDPDRVALSRFIEAQIRLETPLADDARRKLEGKKRRLQRDHGRAWLGDLACHLLDHPGYEFELWRGWLVRVVAPEADPVFLTALASAPAARLLRSLEIAGFAEGDRAHLAALLDAPWLEGLQELRVGEMICRVRPAEALRRLVGEGA